jgi:branched-chain amino acid transport system substrate-binding protein
VLLRLVTSVWLLMFTAVGVKADNLVVAAPFQDFPTLAAQMLDGATAALAGNWVVVPVEAGCSDESAKNTANLIIAEKPDAVIGLPCIESLKSALNALGPIGIPIITIASHADAPSKIAMANGWRLNRVGPRERDESMQIAKLIVDAWRNLPFAIIDDGTIFARDVAEAIRNEAEIAGVKPVLVDGFEPQLENQKKLIERLVASGATHVFIASDRANIAQIANEASAVKLTIAGPETLLAADLDFPLAAGVLMAARDVSLSDKAKVKITSQRKNPFEFAEGYSADAYVAAEIAMALKIDPKMRSMATAFGPISIADDGFIEPVSFALFRYDGSAFQKVAP